MTSEVENVALEVAKQVDPNAAAIPVAEAAIATAADPSPSNIMNDVELAISLVKQLHASLAGTHPTVMKVIKGLIKELF